MTSSSLLASVYFLAYALNPSITQAVIPNVLLTAAFIMAVLLDIANSETAKRRTY